MDWEGEEMKEPPYSKWEPVESLEGVVIAFTNRPCYRKGSHNHFVCEERYAREYTEGSKWAPTTYKELITE
jgi:hypothetical protein